MFSNFYFSKMKAVSILSLIVALGACSDAPVPTTSDKIDSEDAVASVPERNLAQRLAKVEEQVDDLVRQMTLEEKISMIHANSKFTIAGVPRLGIEEMWMSDGPHGVRYEIERHSWAPAGWDDDDSTYLPPLTGVAASWDKDIAALHGSVLGAEARHRGKDLILGPGVNLARIPLYGRNFEYMGEDPFLAGQMAVSSIKAIQAQDVAATIKHFALNTQELNRTGVDAIPDERTLREVYLPAFEAAVKEGGVLAIMGAYNQVHGTNANQSKHLIMDILKGEWGYEGLVVTDWNVDINTYDAAMNGLDIEMGTDVEHYDDYFMARPLLEMVQQGRVPESVIDDKVARILRVQLRIGMMDPARLPGSRNTDAHRQAARKIATQGVVLLKNEDVLPWQQDKLKHVLVMGPNADKQHGAGGGSSEVKSAYEITPLQGLRQALGEDVEITVMRAKGGDGLTPIASDFVVSRHWTGTPAWQLTRFPSDERLEVLDSEWLWDASYQVLQPGVRESISMSGQLRPKSTGAHILRVSGPGEYNLRVDGELVAEFSLVGDSEYQWQAELQADQIYVVELAYQGSDGLLLGWDTPGDFFSDEQSYLAAAKAADAVIYFAGLSHGDDRESIDRTDMQLPDQQDAVIAKLLQANANTTIFIIGGSAVEMPWADDANAIVWGWYGGMEAGHAFADILLGVENPGGKMPITLPKSLADTAPITLNDYHADVSRYTEGVFIGHRWFEQQGIEPLFPFGHGLSYTQFSYSDIEVSEMDWDGASPLIVEASITNTGERAGAEVAQLYVQDMQSKVSRPLKELKGFDKVHLQPGETKVVRFELTTRELAFWDVERNDWHAEPGEFTLHLGASVVDVRLQTTFVYSPFEQ